MPSGFNLRLLNLLVGMCRGDAGLPDALYKLGYRDKVIERRFINADRTFVHPEIVIASEAQRHTVCVESKSGANTSREQLTRYKAIAPADLVRGAYVTPAEATNHDTAVFGLAEYEERLAIALGDGEFPFPLLVAEDRGIRLALNEFAVSSLNDVFRPLLEVMWEDAPTSYFPFDTDSALWEVAEVVMPRLVAALARQEPRIGVRSLCVGISSWDVIGNEGKEVLESRVDEVLAEAARREFAGIFTHSRRAVTVTDNPVDPQVGRSGAGYKRLRKLHRNFLHRLRTQGDQLELSFS